MDDIATKVEVCSTKYEWPLIEKVCKYWEEIITDIYV